MPAKKKPTSLRRRRNQASTSSVLTEGADMVDVEDYQALTVAQLRAELRARGLKTQGHKADLVTMLVAADGPTVPELPARLDVDGGELRWQPATLEWWADLWAAPMSKEYHSSDRHALFILAALMDQFWTSPSTKLAGEIRQQRAAFGLTPYDRRRLEWTIETAEGAKAQGQRRRSDTGPAAPPAPEPASDPRLVLVQ